VIALWTQEHLDRLREVFPDRCPDPGTDLRVMDRLTGNIEVIRFVQRELEGQQQAAESLTGGIR